MTKKEIYAKHGIIYNNGKILFNGKYICELLKEGNTKTGKRVYTWSLLPGTEGTCVCNCKGCYAMTGHYNRKNVKESLTLNTEIVNNDIDFFYHAIYFLQTEDSWLPIPSTLYNMIIFLAICLLLLFKKELI